MPVALYHFERQEGDKSLSLLVPRESAPFVDMDRWELVGEGFVSLTPFQAKEMARHGCLSRWSPSRPVCGANR